MKKKYIAPDLYFESFVLSQSIALNCTAEGMNLVEDLNKIGYFDTSASYAGISTCSEAWLDGTTPGYEGFCYYTDSDKLFLS